MLDAFDRIQTETEEDAVRRSEIEHAQAESARVEAAAARSGGIGVWGASPTRNDAAPAAGSLQSSASLWRRQSVLAAAAMMAPLAAAQESALAMRRARALGKHWSEALSRCRNMDELVEVNRTFGEEAMSLGAGEVWRFVERASQVGRAAVTPKSET